MKKIVMALALLSLPRAALAADARPAAVLTEDDGLSPLERFDKGTKWGGAFSLYDSAHCSQKAAAATLRAMWLQVPEDSRPAKTFSVLEPKGELSFGKYTTYTVDAAKMQEVSFKSVNGWMKAFIAAGDPLPTTHHVCVGLADMNEPNAVATGGGFIFVDPRVVTLPDHEAYDFRAYDAILAHEFGHELQYWGGNPYDGDKTVRRTELVADCIAGGLLTGDEIRAGKPASAAGAFTLGEKLFRGLGSWTWFSPGFHGTPDDRAAAVPIGMHLVFEADKKSPGKPMKGADLKASCEAAMKPFNQDFSINSLMQKK